MNTAHLPRLVFRCLAISGLLVLGGCNTPAEKTADQSKKDKEDYVYYYPTGSNIPMKVRREDLKATDAESAADQAALRRAIQRGTKQDKGTAGH